MQCDGLRGAVVSSDRGTGNTRSRGICPASEARYAQYESERQEREAVRGAEEEGDVEAARRQDCELAECIEARRPEVGQRRKLEAGRYHRAAQGRGPQG